MTEAEALDMAAKAAGWDDWEDLFYWSKGEGVEYVRAHAKTIKENAALKAEIEALKALQESDGELLTIAWMDGAHCSNKAHREQVEALKARVAGLTQERDFHRETTDIQADRIDALKAENERLREAMTAMHKDLLLRAEIDIRDGTKIVHASNGVWLKFCAALKEIEGD